MPTGPITAQPSSQLPTVGARTQIKEKPPCPPPPRGPCGKCTDVINYCLGRNQPLTAALRGKGTLFSDQDKNATEMIKAMQWFIENRSELCKSPPLTANDFDVFKTNLMRVPPSNVITTFLIYLLEVPHTPEDMKLNLTSILAEVSKTHVSFLKPDHTPPLMALLEAPDTPDNIKYDLAFCLHEISKTNGSCFTKDHIPSLMDRLKEPNNPPVMKVSLACILAEVSKTNGSCFTKDHTPPSYGSVKRLTHN